MKINLVLPLVFVAALAAHAADPLPGIAPSTNINANAYPRILPDNSVVFEVKAPQAHAVAFRTDKAYPATRDADGVWTTTTDPQVPGFHYYWLVVDDVPVADPASSTF